MSRTLLLKTITVLILIAVIMLPLNMIGGVIAERGSTRAKAIASVAESSAGAQSIGGPVVVLPYSVTTWHTEKDVFGKLHKISDVETHTRVFFPNDVHVRGIMNPLERYLGIYKVPLYELQAVIEGTVDVEALALEKYPDEAVLAYGAPMLYFGISDVRGLIGSPRLTVNGKPEILSQGAGLKTIESGLRATLATLPAGSHANVKFSLDLALSGTETLRIAPVGDSNRVEIVSKWPSPHFAGQFLPRARKISDQGFEALWEVSSLASSTQVQIRNDVVGTTLDAFEVSLADPVNPYSMADRAIKYGMLFVVLTFAGFFLFETIKRLPIHPIQYLLVGLGLAIFFLLLISLSEHLPFYVAYLVASSGCIVLLGTYLSYVLRSRARGIAFGSMLTLLYGALYGLLISEDNALMLGALLLFGILAAVMWLTRGIDWYALGGEVSAGLQAELKSARKPAVSV